MKEKRLVLLHPDKDYLERFSAYLEKRSALPLGCRCFSDPEAARAFLKENSADLIILSEEYAGKESAEDGIPRLRFTERMQSGEEGFLPVYRPMDRQIRDIRKILDFREENVREESGKAAVLGFFSPVRGSGQSVSAMLMGMELAESAPTLLINLERYSGLGAFLPRSGGSLSDLLYYARVQGDPLSHLGELTEAFGPLTLVPPAAEPEDLEETRPEDWHFLIGRLRDAGLYRYILLDIGGGVNRENRILELCDRIYVSVREDEISLAKLKEWEEHLSARGWEFLLPRLRTFRLPLPAPESWVEYRELRYLPWGRTVKMLAEADL